MPGRCAAADLPLSTFVLDQLRTPGLPGGFSFLPDTTSRKVSRRGSRTLETVWNNGGSRKLGELPLPARAPGLPGSRLKLAQVGQAPGELHLVENYLRID